MCIRDRAQELAEQGVKELILVAQETTVYGMDLYGRKSYENSNKILGGAIFFLLIIPSGHIVPEALRTPPLVQPSLLLTVSQLPHP